MSSIRRGSNDGARSEWSGGLSVKDRIRAMSKTTGGNTEDAGGSRANHPAPVDGAHGRSQCHNNGHDQERCDNYDAHDNGDHSAASPTATYSMGQAGGLRTISAALSPAMLPPQPMAHKESVKDSVNTEMTDEMSDDESAPRRSSVVDMWRKREEAATRSGSISNRVVPSGNRPPAQSRQPIIVSSSPTNTNSNSNRNNNVNNNVNHTDHLEEKKEQHAAEEMHHKSIPASPAREQQRPASAPLPFETDYSNGQADNSQRAPTTSTGWDRSQHSNQHPNQHPHQHSHSYSQQNQTEQESPPAAQRNDVEARSEISMQSGTSGFSRRGTVADIWTKRINKSRGETSNQDSHHSERHSTLTPTPKPAIGSNNKLPPLPTSAQHATQSRSAASPVVFFPDDGNDQSDANHSDANVHVNAYNNGNNNGNSNANAHGRYSPAHHPDESQPQTPSRTKGLTAADIAQHTKVDNMRYGFRNYRSNSFGAFKSDSRAASPITYYSPKSDVGVSDRWTKRSPSPTMLSMPLYHNNMGAGSKSSIFTGLRSMSPRVQPPNFKHETVSQPDQDDHLVAQDPETSEQSGQPPQEPEKPVASSPFGNVKAQWEQRFAAKKNTPPVRTTPRRDSSLTRSSPRHGATPTNRWKSRQEEDAQDVAEDDIDRPIPKVRRHLRPSTPTQQYQPRGRSNSINFDAPIPYDDVADRDGSLTPSQRPKKDLVQMGQKHTTRAYSPKTSSSPRAIFMNPSVNSHMHDHNDRGFDSHVAMPKLADHERPASEASHDASTAPSTTPSRATMKKQLVMARYRHRKRNQSNSGDSPQTPNSAQEHLMAPAAEADGMSHGQDPNAPRASPIDPIAVGQQASHQHYHQQQQRQSSHMADPINSNQGHEIILDTHVDEVVAVNGQQNPISPTDSEFTPLSVSDPESFHLPADGQQEQNPLTPTSINAVKPTPYYHAVQQQQPRDGDTRSFVSSGTAFSGVSQGSAGSSSLANRARSVLAAQRLKKHSQSVNQIGNAPVVTPKPVPTPSIQPKQPTPTDDLGDPPMLTPLPVHMRTQSSPQATTGQRGSPLRQLNSSIRHDAPTPLIGSSRRTLQQDTAQGAPPQQQPSHTRTDAAGATATTTQPQDARSTAQPADGFHQSMSPIARARQAHYSFDSTVTGTSSRMLSTIGSSATESFSPKRDGSTAADSSFRSGIETLDDATNTLVPDEFVSESAANVNAFQSAYQSLSLEQIANDFREEVAGSVAQVQGLDFHKLASDFNFGVSAASDSINKLVGTEVFSTTKPKTIMPKNAPAIDEGVAIEVEYIEETDAASPRPRRKTSSRNGRRRSRSRTRRAQSRP